LRSLSELVTRNNGALDVSFLQKKASYHGENEMIVNLMLDEIHVKSKLSFRGGKLIGQATNLEEDQANSIQCFMVSSIRSDHKLVVGMFPVKKMDSEFLFGVTKIVIENLCRAGYDVVSVISDNNRINRKMFSMLTEGTESTYFITNPINPEKNIYLLFDSVHLLKSIRNNGLNVKNPQQIFHSIMNTILNLLHSMI